MPVEVDLHLHTTQSDGRLTPMQLVQLVAGKRLKVVAITDHDITDGLEEAYEAAKAFPQLTIIPGVELSTDIPGNEVHMLGLYVDYQDAYFQETLAHFREGRVGRAREMVDRLAALGMPVDWERVVQIAGEGAIGRPHIAQALVEKGYFQYPQEAFENYLGRNGLAYAEREKMTPQEAVRLIRGAGGVAAIAHPASLFGLDNLLAQLKAAGMQGMEVHYAEYDGPVRTRLADAAKRHGLVPCGGSDYHAFGTPGERLPGDLGPPMQTAVRLRELAHANARERAAWRS
ncbi:MAG: PHP domain-containing protein [Chloroflexi bacterium]|nr:PHP domain-containing protein [Chloroflexota bacterium]